MADPPSPPLIQEHTIVLRFAPSSVPESIRVRRALKCLLRTFGARCVDYNCVDVPARPAAGKEAGGSR